MRDIVDDELREMVDKKYGKILGEQIGDYRHGDISEKIDICTMCVEV